VRALPTSLRLAVALLLLEAVGVALVAVVFGYDGLTQRAPSAGGAISVVAVPALLAAVLGLLGVQLARCRGWARGPAVALELLLAPLGYYMVIGGAPWLGVPAIAAALACTVLLLAPGTRAALGIH